MVNDRQVRRLFMLNGNGKLNSQGHGKQISHGRGKRKSQVMVNGIPIFLGLL